jgi:formate-dependent nitrite reductase cytochrome c552 subunit/major membrane immunogen (membrane-anchored lipoprotein)
MNYFRKKQATRIGVSILAVAVAVIFLTGIIGGKAMTYQVKEPLTPMLQGITDTMAQNAENSEAEDYLEQDPYLVNIYEGFGFAKDYLAARGHAYTLEDVTKTQRPHAKANCITCKTPDFTKMVNEEGVEVYSRSFDDVMGQMTQAISCYTCHGDDKGNNGQIVITHSYVDKALGENASAIDPKTLNCGQCHIEYYFTPEDSETMMPYSSKEEMTPEAILAYYDEKGFSDWEQPGTGTKMLKAQHPEMETFLASTHATMGLNCSSCHMAEEKAEDGTTYHSHYLVSPLKSETLMATCASCHGSADAAKALVTSTQEKVTARETETGNRLSELKDTLTAAVSEAKMTEEELDAVRKLHREAQWFFDFCYVENSEGAHNSKLSIRCLDTADEKIAEAMTLLTGEAPAAAAEETPAADGALSATVQGFGGDVTVQVELNDDGTVKTLTIDTPNETAGLGQRASEAEFTDQFIGKAGPFTYGENGVDALSGATITSNAVLEAINGLVGGAASSAPVEETPAADGALSATVQGFGGDVTVHMELNDDGTVKTLTIDTPNETAGLGQRASEAEFTDQFIGKAGPFAYGENGVDALSGATITSNAVLEAINGLVGGAAAAPAEETKTEEPAAAETKTEEPAAEEKTAEETKTEQPAETAAKTESSASAGQVYGSYMSEKETDFSKIRVLISTKNDVITECKITSEAKSEGSDFLKDEIKTEWAKAIVEAQGAENDTITGATLKFSAGAVTEAVAEIKAQMAGEAATPAKTPAAEETKTEQPAEEKPAEEKPAETAAKTESSASDGQVYGSYMSEKETDFSKIRVLVNTKNDMITGCKIICDAKEGQTDLVTDENEETWAKAVVETQGAELDNVTGATVSSNAVKEAVAEILQQIAGETPAAEQPAEEAKAEEPAAEEKPAEEAKAEEPAAEEKPAEEKPAEEAKTEETKTPSAYGGYLAEKETAFSTIRVIISTHSGEIVGCKVICDAKEGQTDLVTDENEANWAKAIVETQGAEIDTVTGATISSDAVKEAVTEILAKIR